MSLYVDISKKLGKFELRASFESGGGVLGLLGASGSGKSITLKCIAGIEKPDKGKIVLDGVTLFDSERKINLPPQSRKVGYLFQNYALFPNMNVRQNILCGLHNEPDKRKREKSLGEMTELMKLGGMERQRPSELSGGEQQRVALARILVGNPNLLLLDEPFSALDTHLRGQLQIQMQNLTHRFGKDVILVTHSRNEAYLLCGKIALIDSGVIIAQKGTKELFADPGSRRAALITGCKNIADARKTGEYEAEVPAWGVRLKTELPLRDGLCAVGIRAHYFSPTEERNRNPVTYTSVIEEPFEYIVQFRFTGQSENSQDVWWRIPKGNGDGQRPGELGIAPINVLPLYL